MKDIVIVGGGPTGLYTAYQLAELGYEVVLFEDHADVGDYVVCTGVIGSEAFERFDLPRQPILDSVRAIRAFSPLGSRLEFRSPSTLAYIVSKRDFNRELARWAEASGVDVRLRSRVVAIRTRADAIEADVRDAEKGVYTVRAKLLVIASGIDTKMNKQLGLGRPKDLLRGAQAEIRLNRGEWTEVYFGRSISPGAFAWVVPYQGQWARIGLITEANARVYFCGFMEKHFPAWQQAELKVAYKSIAQGFPARSFADRIIVVGEAAGQVKTTTGGGIFYGLLCSAIAADSIASAFRAGRFEAAALAEYERRWKKEIGSEVTIGYYVRKLFARLNDDQIEGLFRLAQKDGIMDVIRRQARFDWHKDLILQLLKHPLVRSVWR